MRAIASLSRASFMFSCARATGTGADQDDKLDPSKTKKLCELQNLRTGMLPRTAPQRSRAMRTQTHGCLAESCVLRAACCVLLLLLRSSEGSDIDVVNWPRRDSNPRPSIRKRAPIPLCYGVACPVAIRELTFIPPCSREKMQPQVPAENGYGGPRSAAAERRSESPPVT